MSKPRMLLDKKFYAVLVALGFLLAAENVHAFPKEASSPDFADWCEKNRDGECRVITVSMRGSLAAHSEDNKHVPSVCVPDPIDGGELTDRIIRRLREAKFRDVRGFDAMTTIIQEDYPCR